MANLGPSWREGLGRGAERPSPGRQGRPGGRRRGGVEGRAKSPRFAGAAPDPEPLRARGSCLPRTLGDRPLACRAAAVRVKENRQVSAAC